MHSASRRMFDTLPSTWQELEDMVARAFDEMGYESHRNYELSTVRGRVKIDVYAVKKTTPIPTVILCECKHWSKAVEQGVIYGFRSICADVGAHFGLIISKAGFQSGAKETRDATNVHLLDFTEFQETFFDEWRTGLFMKFAHMSNVLSPLVYNEYTTKDQVLQSKLKSVRVFEKYAMFFGKRSYSAYFIKHNTFPAELPDPRGDPHDVRIITVESPRRYYEIATQGFEDARKHFGL